VARELVVDGAVIRVSDLVERGIYLSDEGGQVAGSRRLKSFFIIILSLNNLL